MAVSHTVVSRVCPNCKQSYPYKESHICPVTALAAVQAQPDDLAGTVLGERYRIESFLSRGGMGTVYLGRHIVLDKVIAIKVLSEAKDEVAQQRFLLEAKSACQVSHEHIVDITDYGVLPDGRPYLVMEFLQGQPLDAVIARGPLPPLRACRIAEQIAQGLQAVHDKGILHRDLKPANVFLLNRRRDHVKILDFGIAKLVSEQRPPDSGAPGSVPFHPTQEGIVLGTPEYIAPEQAMDEVLDARADQYALGCILYEMLTGEVPWKGSSGMATVIKRLGEAPVPPRQKRPDLDIPPSLEAVTLRAMARDREQRFSSMAEMALALQQECERIAPGSSDLSMGMNGGGGVLITPFSSGAQSTLVAPTTEQPAVTSQPGITISPSALSGGGGGEGGSAASPASSELERQSPPALGARRLRLALPLVGLLVVGLGGLLFALTRQPAKPVAVEKPRTQTPAGAEPKQKAQAESGMHVPLNPPSDEPRPANAPEPVDSSKDSAAEVAESASGALYRLSFENATAVAVTVSCGPKKTCTMAAGEQCQFRIGKEAGKCEATARGHLPRVFSYKDLRGRARGGRIKEKVLLDAKGLGQIKL